jgi:hypothetical protein
VAAGANVPDCGGGGLGGGVGKLAAADGADGVPSRGSQPRTARKDGLLGGAVRGTTPCMGDGSRRCSGGL